MNPEGKKIVVDTPHIEAGSQESASMCPIALAVYDKFGTFRMHVRVEADTIEFDSGFYDLPESAQRFVKEFDAGAEVFPFAFRIGRGGES